MNIDLLLDDIDECEIAYHESYVDVLDSMISMYDKRIELLDNDRTGNALSIIQESDTSSNESPVETLLLAIPRLIAAFLRKIKELFKPAKKKHDNAIKTAGEYSIDKLEKKYELAQSIIENNPGIVLKVGGGIAAAAGGVKLWAMKKAEKAKEKLELKRDIAGNVAKTKAKYAEIKAEADKVADEMIAITIYPTNLKVFALSSIDSIGAAIDHYIEGIKGSISRSTNNASRYKSKKEFVTDMEHILETTVENPVPLVSELVPRGYTKEYSLEDFRNTAKKVADKSASKMAKELNDLSDQIRESLNYFDNKKLIKLSKEETRNKVHQKEADELCMRMVKAATENLEYVLKKVSLYIDNAEKSIIEIKKNSSDGKAEKNFTDVSKVNSEYQFDELFNEKNTANLTKYLKHDDIRNSKKYVEMLNKICSALKDNYKLKRHGDSYAVFTWKHGFKIDNDKPCSVNIDNINISVNPDQMLIEVKRIMSLTNDDKIEDVYSVGNVNFNYDSRTTYGELPDGGWDAIGHPNAMLSSKALFEKLDKAVRAASSK